MDRLRLPPWHQFGSVPDGAARSCNGSAATQRALPFASSAERKAFDYKRPLIKVSENQ